MCICVCICVCVFGGGGGGEGEDCILDEKQVKQCIREVLEKAFHKNAKACRAGFHKKPTKQDGTHMTIRSQITIPTSIFPTTHTIIPYSLFWNGCVYLLL